MTSSHTPQAAGVEVSAPPGLRVYRSNRLEVLFAVMLQVIERLPGQQPDDPLVPLRFTVGSAGMAQWLQQRLSERWGVAALVEALYPERTFAEALHALEARLDPQLAALTPPDAPDPWQPDTLTFVVLEAIVEGLRAADPELAPVQAYLRAVSNEGDETIVDTHLLALARQVAEVFDRLITWRGAQAVALSAGDGVDDALSPWLRALWRAAEARIARPHAAARLARLHPRPASPDAPPIGQQPIRIFGLSALPPTALDRIALLARHTAVDLFILCPSNTWWAELHQRRDAGRRWLELPREDAERALWDDLPQGHPLLASLGRTLRDFQVRLEALQDTHGVAPVDVFVDTVVARDAPGAAIDLGGLAVAPFVDPARGAHRALALLQSDLLHMAEPGLPAARHLLQRHDTSLVFHDCAGPIRQVEALRDALLAAFDADTALTCRDVVVMCSDVEAFAPLIMAVFEGSHARTSTDGTAHPARVALPYRLLDLSLRRSNPVADALLRLLALAEGRLTAVALLGLLELAPVRQRFRIADDDLPKLRAWADLSAMRWGADAHDRAAVAQPADAQNTLAFGLDRLLTGVALGPTGLFHDVAPVTDIVGAADHALLGALAEFTAVLVRARREAARPRPLAEWITWLVGETVAPATDPDADAPLAPPAAVETPAGAAGVARSTPAAPAAPAAPGLLDRFTATAPADAWWSERVRSALIDLGQAAATEDATLRLDLGALVGLLAGQFELPGGSGQGDPAGITVSSLVPMRGQPYKIIALLGMDDGKFPRPSARRAFDPVSAAPRMGDPSRPDEDRGALLEAILAAREQLWCFYGGRDPRTQKPLPPSVVIAELRDVVDLYFAPPTEAVGAESTADWLTVVHPLQAFSEADFTPRTEADGPPQHVGDHQARSFDARLAAAVDRLRSARLTGERLSDPLFFSPEAVARVAVPDRTEGEAIELDALCRFFPNPLKRFLGDRLSLWPAPATEALAEREPLDYEPADTFRPIGAIVAALTQGEPIEHIDQRLRAEGRLPLGRAADRAIADIRTLARHIQEKILVDLPEPVSEAPIQFHCPEFSLVGTVTGLRDTLDLTLCEKKDVLVARPWWLVTPWLGLLARQVAGHTESRLEAAHVFLEAGKAADQRRYFSAPAPEEAVLLLARLIAWYRLGQRQPLPWAPAAGYLWAHATYKHFSGHPAEDWDARLEELPMELSDKAAKAVATAWQRDQAKFEVTQVFGPRCPAFEASGELSMPFMRLARDLWVPILLARTTSAPKPKKPPPAPKAKKGAK